MPGFGVLCEGPAEVFVCRDAIAEREVRRSQLGERAPLMGPVARFLGEREATLGSLDRGMWPAQSPLGGGEADAGLHLSLIHI